MLQSASWKSKRVIFVAFIVCSTILTFFYYNEDILQRCNLNLFLSEDVKANITSVVNQSISSEPMHSTTSSVITTHGNMTLSSKTNSSAKQSIHTHSAQANITPALNQSISSKPVHSTISTVIATRSNITLSTKTNSSANLSFQNHSAQDLKFLVSSNHCKMLDLDPYNADAKRYFTRQKYKSCTKYDLLTYVNKTDNNNNATLFIDKKLIPSYSANGVNCCYSTVRRTPTGNHPDNSVTISPCQSFSSNITLQEDPVLVRCYDNRKKQVYENAHQAILINEDVQKKIDNLDNNATKKASILFVGIDSISRLNFIRAFPKTWMYLEDTGWLTLKGYNKIGDNTFPNLMGILTGMNVTSAYKLCEPTTVGTLDRCPLIWKTFEQFGYITGYAEDESTISTFNYHKVGFKSKPTDYYLRPYVIATEKLKLELRDSLSYCTGPETAGERIMNLAKDFAVTFKDYPSFGFFWMNTFSHNDVSMPSSMDEKTLKLFSDLEAKGVLEESVVIFLSDHGIRFGKIRSTQTGWLEERLPFIYFSFPKWFRQKYPTEIENFKDNLYRLTTPYDLHMTLQHILHMSGMNGSTMPAEACPKCKSLFEVMDEERSCEDASIEPHWCTCYGYARAEFSKDMKTKIGNFVVEQIHQIIKSRKHDHRCAKYSVEKILDFRVAQNVSIVHEMFVVVQLQLRPNAIVESTVSINGNKKSQKFNLAGGISRLDSYLAGSKCVNDSILQMYCSCNKKGERL